MNLVTLLHIHMLGNYFQVWFWENLYQTRKMMRRKPQALHQCQNQGVNAWIFQAQLSSTGKKATQPNLRTVVSWTIYATRSWKKTNYCRGKYPLRCVLPAQQAPSLVLWQFGVKFSEAWGRRWARGELLTWLYAPGRSSPWTQREGSSKSPGLSPTAWISLRLPATLLQPHIPGRLCPAPAALGSSGSLPPGLPPAPST